MGLMLLEGICSFEMGWKKGGGAGTCRGEEVLVRKDVGGVE
jgi:hypothetical protein